MGLLWTIVIILLCLGALTGVGFLIDHILSGESACKTASNCSSPTPHCQSGKCVRCTESKHCSGATPRCHNGVCVAALRCSKDSECKAGEECDNGKCVPILCTATSSCEEPLVCKDGKCTLECTQSSQCSANEECKANRCVPKTCGNHTDCTPPLRCKDGTCQIECVIDEQCPTGKFCDNGVCTVDFTCSKKADCGVGEVCSQGSCSRPCVGDGVCPSGSECSDGICVRTRLPCPSNATNVKGICVKKLCTSGADCGGMNCVQGKCEPWCQSDLHCPDGEQCREGRCIKNKLRCTQMFQWDGRDPDGAGRGRCAWIYIANSGRAPNAADQRFLMFDGHMAKIPCLERCIHHPDCAMVYFDDKKNPNECRMYSTGVNTSSATHRTGTTARKVYQPFPP
jgi:hypothetical protein